MDRLVYIFFLYFIIGFFYWNVFIFQRGGILFFLEKILYVAFETHFLSHLSSSVSSGLFLINKIVLFLSFFYFNVRLFLRIIFSDFSLFSLSLSKISRLLLHEIHASLWNWFRAEINFSIISRAAYLRTKIENLSVI